MQAAPYILMAAGTAANMAAERNADKERRGIINKAMERTDQAQDKASAQLVAEGQNYGADKRLLAMQAQEQAALAQALGDVGGSVDKGAGAQMIDAAGDAGAVSGDFIKSKADRALSEGDRLTAIARELSKVRAPGRLRNEEGLRQSAIAGELSSAGATNRALANADSLDAQNVQAPWWGTVGKLAAAAGSAWAGGAAAGAGGAGAGSGAYTLGGQGGQLGPAPASSFWGNTARIRFGG